MKLQKFVIQVSPYPPEPGTDYYKFFALELAKTLKMPIIVLASLHHLELDNATKFFSTLERDKDLNIIVYRSFWAPRIIGQNLNMLQTLQLALRYIISSLKSLYNIIRASKNILKGDDKIIICFHYGPSTWPGGLLGEHYVLGMLLARFLRVRTIWIVHGLLPPRYLYEELKDRVNFKPLIVLGIMYYYLLLGITAFSSCKLIVLTNSQKAQITTYLMKLFGKKKIIEMVHPIFKPINIRERSKRGEKIRIVALGYIRYEKGYHNLLKALLKIKREMPHFFNKLEVTIAGGLDVKRRIDLEYLLQLLRMRRKWGLYNVKFILKRLNMREWHEILANSDIIWCAYERPYGPSGILAWARTYKKRALGYQTLWGRCSDYFEDFHNHIQKILKIIDTL